MFETIINYIVESEHTDWASQIFIIIFFTGVLNLIVNKSLKSLEKKLTKTKNLWDDAVITAFRRPLRVLIWILGFTFAIEILYKETETEILTVIYPLRDVAVIATLTWFVIRFIQNIETTIIDTKKRTGKDIDKTTLDAIGKILRAAVVITAALIVMQTLGFSISGVLAFGGVGGLAIGFAAKDLLSNFFGALMVYLDRPFIVGDWIRSPDRNIEGTVEKIGWRQTRIRTFEKRPLYIPNSVFSTIAVENPSRMSHRRIKETIGVRYDDVKKLDVIIKDIKKMLQEHKEIDENQTLIVNVDAFAASSIDFFIYCFTHTTNWIEFHEIKHDVMLKVSKVIESHGAEIAFPTSTLHIPDKLSIETTPAS